MLQIEELLYKLLWGQLRSLGLFVEPDPAGAKYRPQVMRSDLYAKWFEESKAWLAQKRYLTGDGRIDPDNAPSGDVNLAWREWESARSSWQKDPNLKAQSALLEATMRALPDILIGKVRATDIMFPGSSLELVEEAYKQNEVAAYFNRVLAELVASYVEERLKEDAAAQIRIIEIGAGTGGTSAAVFEKLRPYRENIREYCYTDLSKAFLIHARKEYEPDNPYLTYRIFNVEAPPSGQGIEPGSFDLAIAANVLHATKNIKATLGNIKAVLKRQGLILINELTSKSLIAHLTFGLLEGWWLHEDSELRIPGSPLLAPETWRKALEDAGFGPVYFPESAVEHLGQQLIAGESDGAVRPINVSKPDTEFKMQPDNLPPIPQPAQATSAVKTATGAGELREKTRDYFKRLLADTLQVPVHEIDCAEPLETYGIDSILIGQLNKALNAVFGDVGSTLFFEYQTIEALTGHFLATQRDNLIKVLGIEEAAAGASTGINTPPKKGEKEAAPNAGRFDFLALRSAERQSMPEPIAIIGMSGHFPQADNLEEYWQNLMSGKDCISEIPEERWSIDGFYERDPDTAVAKVKSYCKWGGFIDGVAEFDPLFFRISPREAMNMDPQERRFLQACWEVCEDAGYNRERLANQYQGRVGVFVGINKGDYGLFAADYLKESQPYFPHCQFGSVANRVSYVMDLHGPCMPIDTMCSSTLTAIHEACESLHRQECEMAITGGVNMYLHPWSYIGFCANRMLASDGRCKSFGKGANGFVPGEGVGAILLKPLSRAVADQDHVYAVIRGTAINHGGKTNGYTVPNPVAQGDLIRAVLDKSGVNARTVSYIEAHGTGTELGDPIEITGLTQAFQHDTPDTQFCAIGSVKSNIGHLEAAAGIAGLMKIVLQMQHGQLVPTLNARETNPNINFSKSPFKVQQELADWKRPVLDCDGAKKEYPRIAGLSSFGAGGSNAHVIIEEYPAGDFRQPERVNGAPDRVIVVVSAKDEERLLEYSRQLLTWVQNHKSAAPELVSIAYTLQVGREAMEERLALIVRSLNELEEKLDDFVRGRQGIKELYRGQLKRNKEIRALLSDDGGLTQITEVWISRGKDEKLAELWVNGFEVDWNKLYPENRPSRISLPTYPFAKERCWVPEIELKAEMAAASDTAATLHPLLHHNTSDLSEQRFSSTFSGREFFFADHVVNGRPMLPGVAYLEMARAAVVRSTGFMEGFRKGLRLRNIAWVRPVTAGESSLRIHIGLFQDESESGKLSYEIYSDSDQADSGRVLHCRGFAVPGALPEIPPLNIAALRAECNRDRLSAQQCYDLFKTMGIDYGMGHRGLQAIYVGAGQVLAQLTLPSSLANKPGQYGLHPGVMDSALQAAVGLNLNSGNLTEGMPLKPCLPFALQELEVYGNTSALMWAHVRYSKGYQAGAKVQKIDIDLYDAHGKLVVRLKEFTSRALETNVATGVTVNVEGEEGPGDLTVSTMLVPVWDVNPIETGPNIPQATERVLLVGGSESNRRLIRDKYPDLQIMSLQPEETPESIAEKLNGFGQINHLFWIAREDKLKSMTDEAVFAELDRNVLLFFRMIKALIGRGYGSKGLGWTVITTRAQAVSKDDPVFPAQAGLHGLVGSMAKEYPNWKVRLVDLEGDADWPVDDILALRPDSQGNPLVYRRGEWYRQKLIPLQPPPIESKPAQTAGVYVVIGGAGGIGKAWSEYMIKNYQARIVWIGRRPQDTAIQHELDRLAAFGPAPCYIRADAANQSDLERAYQEIKRKYSKINGLVHSAIVLADKSLANMEEERFRASLAAKVDVSVRMMRVFGGEPLDLVLFFSSMQTFAKAPGQSNYAAGCAFKDAFAHQLALERPGVVKVINWGYWGSIGIVASEAYREKMTLEGGGSIEPPEAMEALERLVAGAVDQMAFLKTVKTAIYPDEQMAVYPARLPSVVSGLSSRVAAEFIPKEISGKSGPDSEQNKQPRLAEEPAASSGLETLLCRVLWGQLQSVGLFREQRFKAANLRAKSGLQVMYDRWLEESIRIFLRNNYLKYDGVEYTVTDPAPTDMDRLWEEWNQQKSRWAEDYELKAQAALIEAALRALPEILTGKRAATEIMFPNASMEQLADVYRDNQIAVYYNEVLADFAAAYIEARLKLDPEARIRIIEIGAGTGGTSVRVFEKLKPYRERIAEYCYTDISKAFLIHAEKKYSPENPYLQFKALDIEAPPDGADTGLDGYDILIAANVLHATKNIRQTLRNAKAVLKKHGLVLINEISANSLFNHLTFGLLEGWWLYEDAALRIPGCPGLYSETWQTVLQDAGFRSVFFPAQDAHKLGQQIIVAESDGLVRQKRTSRPAGQPVKTVVKQSGGGVQTLQPPPQAVPGRNLSPEGLKEKTRQYLQNLVGETIKMPGHKIDSAEPLEKYGIDSILVIQLTGSLSDQFDNIGSTLFYEYQTIDALAEYLIQNHRDVLIKVVGWQDEAVREVSNSNETVGEAALIQPGRPYGKTAVRDLSLESLREKTRQYLQNLVGETLKMPGHKIDSAEPLEKYGIDSILVIQLTGSLSDQFDNIGSTLFYEYQTIDALAEYLIQNHRDALIKVVGWEEEALREVSSSNETIDAAAVIEPERPYGKTGRFYRVGAAETAAPEAPSSPVRDIAIIGLSGRYPQAGNVAELWNNIRAGKNCITEIPKERWDWQEYFDEERVKWGSIYTKWGGFIDDIDKFDPQFFQISPTEAERIDPQERLFLETAYASIADAGYTPANLCDSRKIGVFVGVMNSNYPIGYSFWSIANRVSYLFNFQGPSMAVETACSSSLTAIHLALESIYSGASECAIAGGVNLIVDPVHYIKLTAAKMLSAGDQCKVFGARADGFVDGEGVGAVVLKPLSRAIKDGDHIYGVIKGSMVNSGGKTNGYTVPNPLAQARVISDSLKRAKVPARAISYVEAHGSGTELGDPIEITGLTRAFEQETLEKQFCAVGSVKSNIGYSESATGIAGLTKVLLQLKHGELAPSLHSEELNPNIDFKNTPFFVPQAVAEWKRPVIRLQGETREYPRIAGISSFGAGGSNAHMIIAEYIPQDQERAVTPIDAQNPAIVVLSAKNAERLQEYAQTLLKTVIAGQFSDSQLGDLAYTLQVGREAMEERLALIVTSVKELEEQLKTFISNPDGHNEFFRGQVKPDQPTLALLAADEELREAVAKWVQRKKYSKLLELWVEGLDFDWNILYGESKPCRISLSTYPFARERYWIVENPQRKDNADS